MICIINVNLLLIWKYLINTTKIGKILSITFGSIFAVGGISAAIIVPIALSNQENKNINNSPNVPNQPPSIDEPTSIPEIFCVGNKNLTIDKQNMSEYVDKDQLWLYFVQYPNIQIASTINLKAGVVENEANKLFWDTIKGVNISISFPNATLSIETNSFFHFSNLNTFSIIYDVVDSNLWSEEPIISLQKNALNENLLDFSVCGRFMSLFQQSTSSDSFQTFKNFTKLKNFIILSYDAWYHTIPDYFFENTYALEKVIIFNLGSDMIGNLFVPLSYKANAFLNSAFKPLVPPIVEVFK